MDDVVSVFVFRRFDNVKAINGKFYVTIGNFEKPQIAIVSLVPTSQNEKRLDGINVRISPKNVSCRVQSPQSETFAFKDYFEMNDVHCAIDSNEGSGFYLTWVPHEPSYLSFGLLMQAVEHYIKVFD
jgi:hypothetical protein